MMGFIEMLEADGQDWMCRSSVLPADCDRDAFTAMGVTFGPPVVERDAIGNEFSLFVAVTFPEGWQMRPRDDHDMWSELVDSFGRVRATVFYKAAPYDRRAHANVKPLPDEETR